MKEERNGIPGSGTNTEWLGTRVMGRYVHKFVVSEAESLAMSVTNLGIPVDQFNLADQIIEMKRMPFPDHVDLGIEGIPYGCVLTSHGQLIFSQSDFYAVI